MSRATDLLESSRLWVSSLDRSGLGRYAAEDGVLALAHALTVDWIEGGNRTSPHREELLDMLDTPESWKSLTVFGDGLDIPYYTEVAFWWMHNGESAPARVEFSAKMSSPGRYPEVKPVLEKFSRLISMPSHRPYYEAGIWDDTLIARLIENRVDPMLALSSL